ncbi:MAG: putative peptide zinc metalloprotease protein [Acidimicrobiaceae bacterium]|jgi:putative peptide zinc metalloprotease protein
MGRAQRALAALLVVLLACAVSVVAPAPASADDTSSSDSNSGGNGSPINTAIVENTKDNSSVFELAFDVRTITDEATVAPGNAAIAIASCTNCQTVAIAVQIVFVIGSPTVFTPENAAVAANVNCSFCDTLATAYQFVVQSSVPVRFTNDGKHQLHDIWKALKDLQNSGLTVMEIQAKVDELMTELAHVLATEVEPIPPDNNSEQNDENTPSNNSTSASTTTTVTVTSTSTTSTTSTTTTTTTTSSSP